MLRGFFLIFLLMGVAMLAILGFRGEKSTQPPIEVFPDMVRQPKVRPQAHLAFFADDRGMRPPIPGTIPMGYDMPKPGAQASPGTAPLPAGPELGANGLAFTAGAEYQNTGRMGANWGTGLPIQVTPQLLERGRERYNINCSICHGPTAAGDGIVKQYGLATIISLQDERIRKMADGEVFDTITNGKNTMMAYGHNITVNDRWAIVAYLRALQRGQQATAADVPPEARVELEKP
jgi:mono/diheme cytochrome c family protein